MPEIWHLFKQAMQNAPVIDVGRFVLSGCAKGLSDEARAAYDAPFPSADYQAGPRAMPGLVPITPDDPAAEANRAAWTVLSQSPTPVLIAFSDSDPITGPMGPILQRIMPGAAGREHPTIMGGGHFLQEDAGPELASHIVAFIEATPAQ